MARIGFVGLGHMGMAMAINLIKSGHSVTGFDLKAEAMRNFMAAQGIAATSLADVARQDVIITMLQTGEQVFDVCLGAQGLFNLALPHTLFIDCSSIAVSHARTLQEHAARLQLLAVDAPVSGGVNGAVSATLTIMVGGTQAGFERAHDFLTLMGKKIIYTGASGSGQAAKICNNMILGVSMIAVSEAFLLADKLGLEPQKLFEVANNSSGQCWVMSKYPPVAGILADVPAEHDYQPGFSTAMMLKDLCLSQQAASATGIKTPLGAHAMELYKKFNDEQEGRELDFSAIIKMILNYP